MVLDLVWVGGCVGTYVRRLVYKCIWFVLIAGPASPSAAPSKPQRSAG